MSPSGAIHPSPGQRRCELIPAKAKAFRAEAQSRREHKENKAVTYFESLRLCASSIIFSRLQRPGNQGAVTTSSPEGARQLKPTPHLAPRGSTIEG